MMRKVKENKIDDLVMKYFHLAQDKTEVFWFYGALSKVKDMKPMFDIDGFSLPCWS